MKGLYGKDLCIRIREVDFPSGAQVTSLMYGVNMVSLVDFLAEIDRHGENEVVFMRRPWGVDSDIVVGELEKDCSVPVWAKDGGYEYFMEVFAIRDAISPVEDKGLCFRRMGELVVFYAEYDAYPDWVFDSSS